MQLSITKQQLDKLISELRRAGRREIGGVLVGEHKGADDFVLIDLSVQRGGGGHAHFRRDPKKAARFVSRAIAVANGEAERVNYLGEWHSHPLFSASPSPTDLRQMQAIVDDPDEPATFAVLIIVSGRSAGLAMSATLFRSGFANVEPVAVKIIGVSTEAGWAIVSPDPPSHDHDVNESQQSAHGAPTIREGGTEWLRLATGLTERPWWRRWCGSDW